MVWTKLAVQDLYHVRHYISMNSPKAADAVMAQIARLVEALLSYQSLGRIGRVKGTRELVIVGTPYIVPYRVKLDRIEILAVIHSSRRWPASF